MTTTAPITRQELHSLATECTLRAMKLDAAALSAQGFAAVLLDSEGRATCAAQLTGKNTFNMMGLDAGTVSRLSRPEAALLAQSWNTNAKSTSRAAVLPVNVAMAQLATQARSVAAKYRQAAKLMA